MMQLIELLGRALAGASPLLLVTGLLALAERRDRRARAIVARQTRLSDALAEAVGPIVAPSLRRVRGAWRVTVRVPLGRPAVVARIVGVLDRTLAEIGPDPYEVVLRPEEPASRPRRVPTRTGDRRLRAA